MDYLDEVVYFRMMLNMSLDELVRLNYAPGADAIHQRIYSDNVFWQEKTTRDFNVTLNNELLNWRYAYWMLHESHGDIDKALRQSFLETDLTGGDILAKLGAKIPPEQTNAICDWGALTEKLNVKQWQCVFKHIKVTEQHLRTAIESNSDTLVAAIILHTDFIIDSSLITQLYRFCYVCAAGIEQERRLVARSLRIDRQLFIDCIKASRLSVTILQHLIEMKHLPTDIHDIISSAPIQTLYACVKVLVETNCYTTDTLIMAAYQSPGLEKEFFIMFASLKDTLTQDQIVELLGTNVESINIALLTQTRIDLSEVNICVIMEIGLYSTKVVKCLLMHDSFNPAQHNNQMLLYLLEDRYELCIDLLLADPRVQVTDEILTKANSQVCSPAVFEKLLKHTSVNQKHFNKFSYNNILSCNRVACSSQRGLDPFACIKQ